MSWPRIKRFGDCRIAEKRNNRQISLDADRYSKSLLLFGCPCLRKDRILLVKNEGRSKIALTIGTAEQVVVPHERGARETQERPQSAARKCVAAHYAISMGSNHEPAEHVRIAGEQQVLGVVAGLLDEGGNQGHCSAGNLRWTAGSEVGLACERVNEKNATVCSLAVSRISPHHPGEGSSSKF